MKIRINKADKKPIYQQISEEIRKQIASGILPEGYKLPPERKLSLELNVNRSTILNAYRELKSQDLISSLVGRGTIVNTLQDKNNDNSFEVPNTYHWKQFLSENSSRMRTSLGVDIMEIANRKDIISFAAGIANSDLDPIEDFKLLEQELLKTHGSELFKITPTEGIYPLRESIQSIMQGRGVVVDIKEIMVLSGSQQGIDFVARALINPGDVVLVEEPTFFCALQVFKALGAKVIGIPLDNEGLSTEILEGILKRYKPVLLYTIPTFQNPTGAVMSLKRRKQLLTLAYKYQLPILEDDPYYELRYVGSSVPPIKALDSYGYVIYISSFSKVLFQGLRVGWMVAPTALIEQISMLKQMSDLHSSSLPQWIIHGFYEKNLLENHITKLKKDYMSRKSVLLKALEDNKIKDLQYNNPEGGLFIWCKLPENINMSVLVMLTTAKKVAFLPGYVCFPDTPSSQFIRLNFTFTTPDQIRKGINLLKEAICSAQEEFKRLKPLEKAEIKPLI